MMNQEQYHPYRSSRSLWLFRLAMKVMAAHGQFDDKKTDLANKIMVIFQFANDEIIRW